MRSKSAKKTKSTRKITVELPSDLLETATDATGLGITPTIRKGLELVAAAEAYEKLSALRGKVRFSLNLNRLREDRP